MQRLETFSKIYEIGWNHLDANAHVKNSAYAEFGDDVRIAFWQMCGVSPLLMHELGIGPILFDSYIQFFRELQLGETIVVDLALENFSEDFRKWKIIQHIFKQDGLILAAKITLNGSFMDLKTRKVCPAIGPMMNSFLLMPTKSIKES
ncbi:MAG: acyl-CoA thioesterase [Spirosomaceae bacterium]|jgi:acyl-CoA thioester hydrolase|nr:acyl-CoA thioesterase [Spirosomataceae bacterium]